MSMKRTQMVRGESAALSVAARERASLLVILIPRWDRSDHQERTLLIRRWEQRVRGPRAKIQQ